MITRDKAQELRAKYDAAVAEYQKQLDDLDARAAEAAAQAAKLAEEIGGLRTERRKVLLDGDAARLVEVDNDLKLFAARLEIEEARGAALREERQRQELFGSDPALAAATEILTGPGRELAQGLRAEITKAAQDYVSRCRELLGVFSTLGSIRRDAVLLAARTGGNESLPDIGGAAMPSVLMDAPGPAGSDVIIPSGYRRFRSGNEPETLAEHLQRISVKERLGPSVDVGVNFPGQRRSEVIEIEDGPRSARPVDVTEAELEGHSDVPDIAPHRQRGLLVNHKRAQ